MSALSCTIRPACPSDLPTIQAMKRSFALDEGTVHALDASEADWQRDLFGPAPRFKVFLADRAGTVLGMIILSERFFPGQTGAALHINNVFVVPQCRSRGIGRALLGRAAQEAISRKASFIELGVLKDSRARKHYRKAGFAQVQNYLIYVLAGSALSRLADVVQAVAGP
jgi:ribosomal protein S18 acetylase RimI-like enzyme